jgi:hypothetical protein
MRLFARLTVCAAAAMLLSAILFYIADSWFGESASAVAVGRQLLFEMRRAEALDARGEMVARSVSVKRDVIDQLLAGRLNLRQAIAQFRIANELVENADRGLIPTYWIPTDPEGVGRQVFFWLRNAVTSLPREKAQRRIAELEREYRTVFHGANPPKEAGVMPMHKIPSGGTRVKTVAG